MPSPKRKAHAVLLNPNVGSWRQLLGFSCELLTTTTTFPLLVCPFRLRVKAASYGQTADAAATAMDLKLRNETQSQDLTAALDIAALGALAGAQFVMDSTGEDLICEAGDVINLVNTVDTGTTAPGEVQVVMDIERLDT